MSIKLGFILLAAQVVMLSLTLIFHAGMDRQAEQSGIATIIQEASK